MPRSVDTATVLIADDHPTFAEALALALDSDPGFRVARVVSTPWDAREALAEVDVAVIDADFGGHCGLELAREVATSHPSVRIIVLSDRPDTDVLEQALSLGAAGYVPKSVTLRHLIDSIRSAYRDQIAVPASLMADLMSAMRRRDAQRREAGATRSLLTDREFEILSLMARGMSTREIASRLFLSVNTVRSHAQNTLTKLGAHSRLEAVAQARAIGLLDTDHAR